MVLGFMSLMLNVIEGEVSKIYIPTKYANRMLPCRRTKTLLDNEEDDDDDDDKNFLQHCSSKVIFDLFIFTIIFSIFFFPNMRIVYLTYYSSKQRLLSSKTKLLITIGVVEGLFQKKSYQS